MVFTWFFQIFTKFKSYPGLILCVQYFYEMFNRPKSVLFCNIRPLYNVFVKFTPYIRFPWNAIFAEIMTIYENCIYDVNFTNTLYNDPILQNNILLYPPSMSLKYWAHRINSGQIFNLVKILKNHVKIMTFLHPLCTYMLCRRL